MSVIHAQDFQDGPEPGRIRSSREGKASNRRHEPFIHIRMHAPWTSKAIGKRIVESRGTTGQSMSALCHDTKEETKRYKIEAEREPRKLKKTPPTWPGKHRADNQNRYSTGI